ncbi:MAG: type II secretion system protein [Candidatus Saccharimonadales bacterium]
MNRRGFTVVELVIVITIMGILLVLGVVNLRTAQASGRDSERKSDVETIANLLDSYYKTGLVSGVVTITAGTYPTTIIATSGVEYMEAALNDIDIDALKAPGITDPTQTFVAATNNVQTASGVLGPSNQPPTINQYVYQPIRSNDALCTGTDECRKFNIYVRLEGDYGAGAGNTIYTITSKNQ